jgi:hypothetical protein
LESDAGGALALPADCASAVALISAKLNAAKQVVRIMTRLSGMTPCRWKRFCGPSSHRRKDEI